MEVRFSHSVRIYLKELIQILYDKEYFGFEEDAIEYVNNLIDDIVTNIERKHKKIAPAYFSKFGKNLYYISYRRNKNTTWHVFFNYAEGIYLIRYIGNNHNIGQHL